MFVKNARKPINLTKLFKKSHVGKWVALTMDRKKICGIGRTISEALEAAQSKGYVKVVFHKVLPFDSAYA